MAFIRQDVIICPDGGGGVYVERWFDWEVVLGIVGRFVYRGVDVWLTRAAGRFSFRCFTGEGAARVPIIEGRHRCCCQ